MAARRRTAEVLVGLVDKLCREGGCRGFLCRVQGPEVCCRIHGFASFPTLFLAERHGALARGPPVRILLKGSEDGAVALAGVMVLVW